MSPCPACNEKRLHTPAERKKYHPLAGHGYQEGIGWSHPDLKMAYASLAPKPVDGHPKTV